MNNIARAEAFIRHWEDRDPAAIAAAVAEDVFYHNIPMPPMTGREAVREFAAPFLENADRVQWDVHYIAETTNGAVLTERTDHFHMKTGKTISVRVMGVFEFNAAGEIQKWRDYFDLAEFQSQMS
ncbi:MAG: limonene-1,2-epoxide hydrolase family protein [Pseudomonadota bacterium]